MSNPHSWSTLRSSFRMILRYPVAHPVSDLYLCAKMDLREPSTFSRVYADHAAEVEAIARRVVGCSAQAQDVTHDVFLRLWVNPTTFDAKRGDVGTYLRMLARSRAIDAMRTRGAAGRAGDRLRAATHALPASATEGDDRAELVRALRKLPGPQREALVLSYWADVRDYEVARHAGIPVGTAKSRIRLGLRRLRGDEELVLSA
jgi:RNA polymerase sigma-70 factor, ECF subfamily